MEGTRFLTASRNAARPDSRPAHRPLKNYKPALEKLWRTGNLSSAPPELAAPYKRLVESARKHGVEKELNRVMSTFFSLGNENKISILLMERLERLISTSPPGQLNQKLDMCNTLMGEFRKAADALPALLAGSKRLTSSGRLSLNSMRRVLRRGIACSKTLCPKEISQTIKVEIESGRMDDIHGVTEFRQEQALSADLRPAMVIPAVGIQTQIPGLQTQKEPQPASYGLPEPVQRAADILTEPPLSTKTAISPLQVWEEVKKLREGDKKPPKKPLVVREEPADKRKMKPPRAAPARVIKMKPVRPSPVPSATAHVKPAPAAKAQKPPEKKTGPEPAAPKAAPAPTQAPAETEAAKSDASYVYQPLIIVPDKEKRSDDDDKPGPSGKFAGGMKVKRKPKKKRSKPRTKKRPEQSRKKKKAKKSLGKAKKKKPRKKPAKKKRPAKKAKPKAKKRPKPRKKARPKRKPKAKKKPKMKSLRTRGRKKRKAAKKRLSAKRKKALKTAKKRKSGRKRRKRKASVGKKKAAKLIKRFRSKKKRRRRKAA